MCRSIHTSRIWLALIAITFCVAVCLDTHAQVPPPPLGIAVQPVSQPNGDFIVMPQNPQGSRQNGFTLNVDTRWVNAYGYRPIEVTISSPVATTTAHTITMRLHAGWEYVTTVVEDFEFPKGATIASTNISLPFYEQPIFGIWWDIEVDGVKDRDLSLVKDDAARRAAGPNISASTIRMLAPGSPGSDRTMAATSVADFEVLSLPLVNFPRRWIDYTCLDVVSVSLTDLQQLAKANPGALEAVERWVRAGGQLWISDAGGEFENLPEISKRLNVPETLVKVAAEPMPKANSDKANEKIEKTEVPAEQPNTGPVEVGWRASRYRGRPFGQAQGFNDLRSGKTRWINDPRVAAQLDQDPNFTRTNDATPTDDPDGDRRPTDSNRWYVEQRLGLGTLRAFRGMVAAELFAQRAQLANGGIAVNANGEPIEDQVPRGLSVGLRSTRRWESRHGLIPDSSNSDFARLLVPGVGRAPVTEFQILITLFGLLIGPFNYWILKRYKRSQLLVLTVPLAAFGATAALFAYAIVSDGFDTKVRIRSYTTIDQSTGEAASWAWSSYYAGIAPGKGLTMSADVVLYPILPNWGSQGAGIDRTLIWSGDQALLTRGWLTSRTPTQYLMVRSRKTPSRLDVTSGNGKMQVVNRLGTRIESLLALDDSGKFFSGDGLANESRTALKPISQNDAVKFVSQWMRDNSAEKPPELSDGDRDYFGRRGSSTRQIYNRYRPPAVDGGQLNENLASRALSDLAGLNGRPALELPARTYVAVTETGPEVETGIPYAKEEGSFHVVVGHW